MINDPNDNIHDLMIEYLCFKSYDTRLSIFVR